MWTVAKEPRRMGAETYKGIEFIRISNLPDDQKTQITRTIDQTKIIKILRGKEVLHDCVQVTDYDHWMRDNFTNQLSIAKGLIPQ